MSINYVTKREYTGVNAATLNAIGVDAVVTFKQATRDLGIPGKNLKGIKSVASLVRFSKTEKVEDEKGRQVAKPIYFSVFDAKQVLARK